MVAGGPEVQAPAKATLSGSADELHAFVQAGQYPADRERRGLSPAAAGGRPARSGCPVSPVRS
ncbi:ALF repeat-containing protein [Streptomyces sp. NPDC002928]|uniref:ALF repeat-containing protein n=1 Tax=Streptomyces sp. NPDC002928 TaxID=3154440 RepID=UPI0033BE82EF